MAAVQAIYCIDTSSILEWYVRQYPPSILPGLPERMEDLIAAGRLRAPRAVHDELSRQADECYRWTKAQTDLFIEESIAVQRIVRRLMGTHHNPQKPLKGINNADPFVIAMALDGGSNWAVISDEKAGTAESRKIPYVCAREGVACLTFQELMKAEGWQFR